MLGGYCAQIFMGRAQRGLCERGWPVFTYHKIGEPPGSALDPFLFVKPREFDHQLAALRAHGFASASLTDFCNAPDSPGRRAIITFDDGAANVLINGAAVLARNNFRAIQFIVAGLIGKQNEWDMAKGEKSDPLMDRVQIREWLASGHEIGSHTSTHPNLKRVSLAEAREEIFGSRKRLEDTFGVPVRHFCYPFGKWTEPMRDLVAEAGYLSACTVQFGVNNSQTPRYSLNRIVPLSRSEWCRKAVHRLARKLRSV